MQVECGRKNMAYRRSDSNHLRILLVEDSEDILFIMKTELEWMGYVIDVAQDGGSGLELARSNVPDVIISDIQMPGISGFEFLRLVRQIPRLSNVPAIALTGSGMEADVKRALDNGFTAHLTKPVEPTEVSALISKLTEKKKGTSAT